MLDKIRSRDCLGFQITVCLGALSVSRAVIGKVAGHPVIVQLKFEMTSTNGKSAGDEDQHLFPKYCNYNVSKKNFFPDVRVLIVILCLFSVRALGACLFINRQ